MSPWWELDTALDSEGKTKTESSSETVKRVVKSPIRIIEVNCFTVKFLLLFFYFLFQSFKNDDESVNKRIF